MTRVTIAVLAMLLLTSPALASERSERIYSRGLVEFHGGRYDAAVELFDRALEVDPADTYARYYRAMTRGRIGDSAGTIADLRAVLEQSPDLSEAALELGIALVDVGRDAEAIPWLERARTAPALDPQASFLLGIAHMNLGASDEALRAFERAGSGDASLRVPALYYRGVTTYRTGDWSNAKASFEAVVELSPDSPIGRESAEFLRLLGRGGQNSYELYGSVGLEYDSNVALAPSDNATQDALDVSDEDDGRVVLAAGGSYAPWKSERFVASLGYDFFQSLHFNLTEFNLQNHQAQAQVAGRSGVFRYGLLGRYGFYLRETDAFLQQVSALPWLLMEEQDVGHLEVSYSFRLRDFLESDFGIRDSINQAPGVLQTFYLGKKDRFVSIGYQYDREEPNRSLDVAQQFAYDGHQVSGVISWMFPADVQADAAYAYRREIYAGASDGRLDNEHRIATSLRKKLFGHLVVGLAYYGTINDSNQADFEYDRHIVSADVNVRF